jgi:phage terminase large subunit-like protein
MTSLPKCYQDLIERACSPIEIPSQWMQNLASLRMNDKLKMLELLKQKKRWQEMTQIVTWFRTPEVRAAYAKQMRFFKNGAKDDERGLFGGNRTGKTHCGVYEDVLHLTGLYPEWWPGRRFDRPIEMWAATDTAKNTRDILQEKFCGKPGIEQAYGTGMIPGDLLLRRTVKHGLADAFESVFVQHISGGVSTLQLKSYDQGRESFQGTRQDLIHLDEEPKLEIYTECLLRLMSTVPGEPNGSLILTETPLLGISDLMVTFMPELKPEPDAIPVQAWESEVAIDE